MCIRDRLIRTFHKSEVIPENKNIIPTALIIRITISARPLLIIAFLSALTAVSYTHLIKKHIKAFITIIYISNCDKSFDVFLDTLKSNMNLNDDFTPSKTCIYDRVKSSLRFILLLRV